MSLTYKRIPGQHGLRGDYEVYAPGHVSSLVRLKGSRIHGTGCFAGQKFIKGYLIGIYAGKATFDILHPKTLYEEAADGTQYGILGEGPLSYMNHHAVPTCEMDGLLIYAAGLILEGEELTIDYGWGDES